MNAINCREFEERLDEWASGTLPDFERPEMARHEATCPACREMAEEARAVVAAARAEGLELPGEGWFADFGARMEEELTARGTLEPEERGWRKAQRARMLAPGQRAAGLVAAVTLFLWLHAGLMAMQSAGVVPRDETTQVTALVAASAPPPANADLGTTIRERNELLEEIGRYLDQL